MSRRGPRARWPAYELHALAVKQFVARRVEPDAVDDIVSETFVVAWRRLPREGEPPDWLLPWLFGVAKRVIHTHRRTYARRTKLLERVSGAVEREVPDCADRVIGDPQLAQAFATLSPREQEAIVLIAWDGLDPAGAAKVAGCSTATFTVRYSRARAHLAAELARLDEQPGDSPAAEQQDRVHCSQP